MRKLFLNDNYKDFPSIPPNLGSNFQWLKLTNYRSKLYVHLRLTGDAPDVEIVLTAFHNNQKKSQTA